MSNKEFFTIAEVAKLLGVSRIAVYKKIKKGQIEAIRIGRNFAIPKKELADILGAAIGEKDKKIIHEAVKKTVKEYGEALRLLGKE
ncbi:MAG: helix-turn-helix domain-containing protein [Patescibacteria group bacterium]